MICTRRWTHNVDELDNFDMCVRVYTQGVYKSVDKLHKELVENLTMLL